MFFYLKNLWFTIERKKQLKTFLGNEKQKQKMDFINLTTQKEVGFLWTYKWHQL